MLIQLFSIVAGVGILYYGGEILVRYSTALAISLNVKPLVIGLTVIAFGTSAPELAAGVLAAVQRHPELAVGNVIGSNIANIGLILGLTVVITPLVAAREFVRREVLFMLATGALLIPFVLTGRFTRWQAIVLLAAMALFLWTLLRSGSAVPEDLDEEAPETSALLSFLGSVAGLALLIGGAQLLVWASVEMARGFGVSERVIGLTVVAFGTSVPELAGCLAAAAKKHTDLVLGNVIGSNVFNTLLVLPTTILIRPFPVSFGGFGVDLLVMVGFSVAVVVFFARDRTLTRWEGVLLCLGYLVYIGYLAVQGSAAEA
ncbi:MAG TPA: calcium/sodium antiporter [Thermoanaerobaculia bacterium]|nr:calcium/sodium antiporter [Thermoanaerobaculia bacterium]